jgi:hypothetical protein
VCAIYKKEQGRYRGGRGTGENGWQVPLSPPKRFKIFRERLAQRDRPNDAERGKDHLLKHMTLGKQATICALNI